MTAATIDDGTRVPVELGSRGYDIIVGAGLIDRLGALAAPLLRRPRTVIVTDEVVATHQLARARAGLDAAGIAHRAVIVPAGEGTKSFAGLERLIGALLDAQVERGDMVLALGGGVVGDLAGFAAATLRRGVDFIQVPTTLLAQVDSSVGGKTGINVAQGKNLVGAFHQPRLVVADTTTLQTLPRRQLLAGYAEVVKYGLIDQPDFFAWAEANAAALLDGDRGLTAHAIATSCRAKARIVAADEREAGQRALLNLGHTFGHALEAACGYADILLHGEAVAIGMVLAFRLSARLGLCAGDDADRIERHLAAVGLPTSPKAIDRRFDAADLIDRMHQDKKVTDGRITFVLARGIGQAFLTDAVDLDAVRETIAASLT